MPDVGYFGFYFLNFINFSLKICNDEWIILEELESLLDNNSSTSSTLSKEDQHVIFYNKEHYSINFHMPNSISAINTSISNLSIFSECNLGIQVFNVLFPTLSATFL